jgi:hypothetical protein
MNNSRSTDGGGIFVGRTEGDDAELPETKLWDAGLVTVGAVGLIFGAGGALGPSEKSPQSSKASSFQVETAGIAFFAVTLGAGLEVGASANSPQSPNESSSHVD